MPTYQLRLTSAASRSYRCQRAANALDIDVTKKLTHTFSVTADFTTPFAVGVIVGASGSGETTFAQHVFGDRQHDVAIDESRPVLDQFPDHMTYEQCAEALTAIGLTSVPTWLRPLHTLSNGQKARAVAALRLAATDTDTPVVFDEWTSVVDRTVAKVMSLCVAKAARRAGRCVVLVTCHYDVVEWLDPEWVVDCNTQTYIDRRGLPAEERQRTETLTFDVRPVERNTWKAFAQYHYLSDQLPGGFVRTYGLFHGDKQIGFQCLAEYVPRKKHRARIMHSNRTVVHPDYAGFGLGILLIDATCAIATRDGMQVMAKFSALPVYKAMQRNPNWKHESTDRKLGATLVGGNMLRLKGFRSNVTTFLFRWVGGSDPVAAVSRSRPNQTVRVSA